MATLIASQKLTSFAQTGFNFQLTGYSDSPPVSPPAYPWHIEMHKQTLLVAMSRNLYTTEVEHILTQYRRSTIDDDSVLSDFFNGDIRKHDILKDENYHRALDFTINAFRPPRKCRPVHLLDIYDKYPFKMSVSAELPFATDPTYKRLLPDQTVHPSFAHMKHLIFSFVRRWIHNIKEHSLPTRSLTTRPEDRYIFPMQLHSKTALIDIDDPNKMRTIWGASKIMILAQVMIYWSYFAWIKKHRCSTPLLWGYETLTGGWFRLNAELFASLTRRSFLMIDWKRFDKYAEFSALRDLFSKRREYFDFHSGYEPTYNYADTTPINPEHQNIRLSRLWHWILEYFFEAEIVLPDGRRFKRKHAGIPSGVYTTQLDDSQYNCLMLATILYALGVNFDVIKLLGDDSLIRLLTCIPPQHHSDFLLALQEKADLYFGSIISIDKSKLSNHIQNCEVLSYTNNHGIPYRSELDALASLYHTKARKPSPEYTMSAVIGYAYALPTCTNRCYNTLKDVFDYYAFKGYSPSEHQLNKLGLIFGQDIAGEIESLHFPTRRETRQRLLLSEYTSLQMEKFWPTDYFIWDV
jgi:hypothetical protein